MPTQLDGATRVHFIVGDPIAQVKSPAGVSQAFAARGHNAIVVPAHVRPQDLRSWFEGISLAHNVDGIIVTVPHKFACYALCDTTSERAGFLQSVNTLRRDAQGRWHGDMFDGLGYVQALRDKGCEPSGKRALLVGAGGAGSAIAHALITAGVSQLAIHDANPQRANLLMKRLSGLERGQVVVGSNNARGYDIAINATPMGMRPGDAQPIDSQTFSAQQFIGCVITVPAVPPMIQAARSLGCNTLTGADMFEQVRALMVEFLLAQ